MLEIILEQHNPCKFTDLVEQLPDDLSNLVRTSQDGLAKALGLNPVNISKLDKKFERVNTGYDSVACTLHGLPCSMSTFIEVTWGTDVLLIVDKILNLGD